MAEEADRRAAFRRLRRELERLLELPAEARREELVQLARREPELARELAALVAADAKPAGLLDGNATLFLPLLAARRKERRD